MTDTVKPDGAMPTLLPCPFCGARAYLMQIIDDEDVNDDARYIECANMLCGVSTQLRWSNGEDCRPLLREMWNRRADLASRPETGNGAEPVAWQYQSLTDAKWYEIEDINDCARYQRNGYTIRPLYAHPPATLIDQDRAEALTEWVEPRLEALKEERAALNYAPMDVRASNAKEIRIVETIRRALTEKSAVSDQFGENGSPVAKNDHDASLSAPAMTAEAVEKVREYLEFIIADARYRLLSTVNAYACLALELLPSPTAQQEGQADE